MNRPDTAEVDGTPPDGAAPDGALSTGTAVADGATEEAFLDGDHARRPYRLFFRPVYRPWRDEARSTVQPAHASDRLPRRWRPIDVGVAVFFLAAAYMVTSAMWQSPTSRTPSANLTDQVFFEYMLDHGLRIFTHGDNPFLVTQLNAPHGVNVMANTGLLGLSIPLAPLTALVGPSAVFVLIIMMGLAGTGFAWYWVLSRHFVHHRFGAFLGGAICGFGPAIMTHANGHPNITAQFVLPFILARALNLRSSTRPVRDGTILGLLIAYQVFLNEELLFVTALAALIFVLVYAAFRPSAVRGAVGPMATGLGMAAVVSAVVVAYPLWYQFKGPQTFSGLPDFLRAYPYRLPLNSWTQYPTLSWHTLINPYPTGTEQNSFYGWWMIGLAIAITVSFAWKHPAVRALAVVGVFFAWASLGDQVVTTNVNKTYPVSLWDHLSHLPLFDSVLAGRMAMVCLPVIGVLVAIAATDCARAIDAAAATRMTTLRPVAWLCGGVAGIVTIALCMLTLVPIRVPVVARPQVPTFFSSGQWRSYVPAGDTVLDADPFSQIQFMRWGIAAGLDFSVPGGYFLGPAPSQNGTTPKGQYGQQWRTTDYLLGEIGSGAEKLPVEADQVAGFQQYMRTDLTYWHTAIIVLTSDEPRYTELRTAITTLLGNPGKQVGDVWLWDVRSITNRA